MQLFKSLMLSGGEEQIANDDMILLLQLIADRLAAIEHLIRVIFAIATCVLVAISMAYAYPMAKAISPRLIAATYARFFLAVAIIQITAKELSNATSRSDLRLLIQSHIVADYVRSAISTCPITFNPPNTLAALVPCFRLPLFRGNFGLESAKAVISYSSHTLTEALTYVKASLVDLWESVAKQVIQESMAVSTDEKGEMQHKPSSKESLLPDLNNWETIVSLSSDEEDTPISADG